MILRLLKGREMVLGFFEKKWDAIPPHSAPPQALLTSENQHRFSFSHGFTVFMKRHFEESSPHSLQPCGSLHNSSCIFVRNNVSFIINTH
jgi:hypothetical protein